MEYNWLDHWKRGDIAFHLSIVNPMLEKYWHQLNIASDCTVLVPLSGKSLDLLWLANRGHQVIGVELSEIACEAFFSENKLAYNKQKINNFICYYNHKIKLFCGDFFALTSDLLPDITAVYDRAALIALPDELRTRYAKHLTQLMTTDSQMLLIVYESNDIIQGPPYPLSHQEIKNYYKNQFQISELARLQKTEFPKHLYDKGYRKADEVVYYLRKQLDSEISR
jgi:thiopurine S-methyltransferase